MPRKAGFYSTVFLRLTPELRQKIEEAARDAGETLTAFFRRIAAEAIMHKQTPSGTVS
jgi:uncharacterized protein (DUF1778 family)